MRNPFPRRNLPPEAEPWGREHDSRVSTLSDTVDRLSQEVTSLRAQTQAFSRVPTTIPVFRAAHADANGDFTIPFNSYRTVTSGSFLAPAGMSRGILMVNSTVVKTPDNPTITNNWIASSVVVSAGGVSYTLPGSNYFGYRDPSQHARETSLVGASRQFEFEFSEEEYEISFSLQAACGLSNFNTPTPGDIASVDIVALFYGEITPEDTV